MIAYYCEHQFGIQRTARALKVKWQGMYRKVQHYLAAQKYTHKEPSSGTTDAELKEQAIRFYCERAGR